MDDVTRLEQRVDGRHVAREQAGQVNLVALAVANQQRGPAAGAWVETATLVQRLEQSLGGVVERHETRILDLTGHLYTARSVSYDPHIHLRILDDHCQILGDAITDLSDRLSTRLENTHIGKEDLAIGTNQLARRKRIAGHGAKGIGEFQVIPHDDLQYVSGPDQVLRRRAGRRRRHQVCFHSIASALRRTRTCRDSRRGKCLGRSGG